MTPSSVQVMTDVNDANRRVIAACILGAGTSVVPGLWLVRN